MLSRETTNDRVMNHLPSEAWDLKRVLRRWIGAPLGLVTAILLVAVLFLGVGCGNIEINIDTSDEPIKTRDDSFQVGVSPKLVVDSFNGRVIVNSGSGSSIRVQATLKKADRIDYQISQEGDTVRVEARQKGTTIGRSPAADI